MSTTIERPNAPGHDTGSHSLTYAGWRIGLWCGAAYCLLGLIFWAGVAGFLPPPHQSWDAERVKEFFSDDRALVGIVGYCFIAPLWVPMSITLSRIMSRIEGRDGILHRIEFVGGIVTSVITVFSGVAWMVAAYQPETRSAGLARLAELHGLGDLPPNLLAALLPRQPVRLERPDDLLGRARALLRLGPVRTGRCVQGDPSPGAGRARLTPGAVSGFGSTRSSRRRLCRPAYGPRPSLAGSGRPDRREQPGAAGRRQPARP